MKVYDLRNDKGNISALILVERQEVERQEKFGGDEALTRAVNGAIMSLADTVGRKLMFPRVLSCDEQDDGAVMVRFEAAAAPQVKLGTYRGLRVPMGEELAERALELAAQGIDAEVPAMIVERELDALLLEEKSAALQNVRLNLLTDIHQILKEGIREVTSDWNPDDLWQQTVETVGLYFSEHTELTMDQMISAAANVLALYGKVTESLCGRLAQIIERRLDERERLTGEALAEQVFETSLRVSGFSVEQWCESRRPLALERTRKNLTLDAVADAEALTVSDEEVQSELEALAADCGLTPEQVRELAGEEALRFDLRRKKAKKLIAEHAIQV